MIEFVPFKGRSVKKNQKVRVYRNLHKPGVVYSIADAWTGLVLGYSESVLLTGVAFKVSAAGRERVLRTGRKNVHAFVIGRYEGTEQARVAMCDAVGYNPRKYSTFVRKFDESPIHYCRVAHIGAHGVAVI